MPRNNHVDIDDMEDFTYEDEELPPEYGETRRPKKQLDYFFGKSEGEISGIRVSWWDQTKGVYTLLGKLPPNSTEESVIDLGKRPGKYKIEAVDINQKLLRNASAQFINIDPQNNILLEVQHRLSAPDVPQPSSLDPIETAARIDALVNERVKDKAQELADALESIKKLKAELSEERQEVNEMKNAVVLQHMDRSNELYKDVAAKTAEMNEKRLESMQRQSLDLFSLLAAQNQAERERIEMRQKDDIRKSEERAKELETRHRMEMERLRAQEDAKVREQEAQRERDRQESARRREQDREDDLRRRERDAEQYQKQMEMMTMLHQKQLAVQNPLAGVESVLSFVTPLVGALGMEPKDLIGLISGAPKKSLIAEVISTVGEVAKTVIAQNQGQMPPEMMQQAFAAIPEQPDMPNPTQQILQPQENEFIPTENDDFSYAEQPVESESEITPIPPQFQDITVNETAKDKANAALVKLVNELMVEDQNTWQAKTQAAILPVINEVRELALEKSIEGALLDAGATNEMIEFAIDMIKPLNLPVPMRRSELESYNAV